MKGTAKQLIAIILVSNAINTNTTKSQLKLKNVFVLLQTRFNVCSSSLINNRHKPGRMAVLYYKSHLTNIHI